MYKSLYRIYRPKKFEDAIGQEFTIKILKNQLIEGKVGHAYLFTGVRGTGKTTFAKILAKAVNCLDLKDGEPCLKCENCKGIEDGSILDIIEMDAASNTGVDNIRSIIDEANYLPTKAKYRVYIIDEVHMLSGGAFNALLKTLEEPPKHVKFILATTEPQKLPVTILSRCQIFDFKKISKETVSNHLEKIAKESKIKISKEALNLIASLGEGSVRDSISILESTKALNKKIEVEDIRKVIGLPDIMVILENILDILQGNSEKAIKSLNEILNSGLEAKSILEEMLRILEFVLIGEEDKIYKYSEQEKNKLKEILEINQEKIYFLLKNLLNLYSELKWTNKKNTIFLAAIIDFCGIIEKTEQEEKNKMSPDEIVNILSGNDDLSNKERIREDENKEKKSIKKEVKNKTEKTNNIEAFEKILKDTEAEIENNLEKYTKFNIINIQKKLTDMGKIQIFVLVSNCEAYTYKNKFVFVKKEGIAKDENYKKISEQEETIKILKQIIKELTNKEYDIEMRGWK